MRKTEKTQDKTTNTKKKSCIRETLNSLTCATYFNVEQWRPTIWYQCDNKDDQD